jgi:hypothetical protein
MLIQDFSERAAECLRSARRASSEHDRELFMEMARAWCGVIEERPQDHPGPGTGRGRPH